MAFPVVDGFRAIEFGTPGDLRDRLVGLVLAGHKRATAGLVDEYVSEGEPVETMGERLAVLDTAGRQVATIDVVGVEIVRFADVPDDFALAEGEGDLSGDDFRASHGPYWTRLGARVDDDTLVVLIRFVVSSQGDQR